MKYFGELEQNWEKKKNTSNVSLLACICDAVREKQIKTMSTTGKAASASVKRRSSAQTRVSLMNETRKEKSVEQTFRIHRDRVDLKHHERLNHYASMRHTFLRSIQPGRKLIQLHCKCHHVHLIQHYSFMLEHQAFGIFFRFIWKQMKIPVTKSFHATFLDFVPIRRSPNCPIVSIWFEIFVHR